MKCSNCGAYLRRHNRAASESTSLCDPCQPTEEWEAEPCPLCGGELCDCVEFEDGWEEKRKPIQIPPTARLAPGCRCDSPVTERDIDGDEFFVCCGSSVRW